MKTTNQQRAHFGTYPSPFDGRELAYCATPKGEVTVLYPQYRVKGEWQFAWVPIDPNCDNMHAVIAACEQTNPQRADDIRARIMCD